MAGLNVANLRGADLCGADLNDANLLLAGLIGANLVAANLSGATLLLANLPGPNLTAVIGLTQQQLDQACGKPAELPRGLSLDKPCPPSRRNVRRATDRPFRRVAK